MSAAEKVVLNDFFAQAVEKAMYDPVWFAEEILQLKALPGEKTLAQDPNDSWELDQWTKDLLNSVADVVRKEYGVSTLINHEGLNQISVRSMHGPGKTFGLAVTMHWFGFCFKGKIPCTAPKIAQLRSRLWPEFRKIRNRAVPGYKWLTKTQGQSIFWRGDNGDWDDDHWAFMETASAPENLAGLHDKFMLICVDEASGVHESLWPVIESAISTGKIVILLIISNPTKSTGTFADSHNKPLVSQDWFTMHIRLEDTQRVSRTWVQRMENKYGKGSPVVQVRCYGEFADDDENQLISLSWIQAGIDTEFIDDGSIPRQRLSVDVADGGTNFSVITHSIHYESFVLFNRQTQHSFPGGKSVSMLVNEVIRQYNKFGMSVSNGDDIVVDSLGVGAGVCSGLVSAKNGDGTNFAVIRYMGGTKSDNSLLYRNRRVQSFMVCRDYHQEGKVRYSDDFVSDQYEWDDVMGQMCSIRRKIGQERVEDLATKEEMKNLGIVSPDRADSIAMQFATQTPEINDSSFDVIQVQGIAETYDAGIS